MNAVEFLAYLINVMVACSALPVSETVIGGQNFQVQSWICQVNQGPITVKSWRRECDTGHTKYWGRLVYISFDELRTAAYLSRYGEVYIGQGAQLGDAYLPSCGS